MADTHDIRIRRAARSLDGLSLGDAFGERFFVHPDHVDGLIASRALPAGPWFWTDDTEMALAIVEVLDAHGGIDRDLLARVFVQRYARDPARGYGAGAHRLLAEIAGGRRWHEAARDLFDGAGSFGNGGAMRAGPIGAFFADDLEAVVAHARWSAEVTHAHDEGQAGAIAVAVAAACATRGARDLFEPVLARTPPGETRAGIERAARLPADATVQRAAAALGTGARVSAMDTVPFALWAANRHLDHFEEAMWTTVAGLGDRDTTCAIVGSIVAMSAPAATVPEEWRDAREPLEEEPVVARVLG